MWTKFPGPCRGAFDAFEKKIGRQLGGGDALKAGGRGSSIDTDLLEIPVEEFGDKTKIGRGSFGEVFRCQVRTLG